jgi:RNA polymerase sigma factor (sigma-70 family)
MSGAETLRIESFTADIPKPAGSELDRESDGLAQTSQQIVTDLYTEYASRIYWYCYLRLGNREDAEDAASLTFAKAFSSLSSCRNDRYRAWIFSVARNVVTDIFRNRRLETPIETAWHVRDPKPTPEEIVLRQEGHDRARSLLARLSEAQRQVVEFRLAGLSGAEIAEALGRTHIWVRVTQLRAYRRLADLLETEQPDAVT